MRYLFLFFIISSVLFSNPAHAQNWLFDKIKGVQEYGKIDDNKKTLEENAQMLQPGQEAPDFTLTSLNGKPVSLSDFRGKPVVLMFWASWCPACRKESKALVKNYEELTEAGIQIFGVSLDREKDDWQRVVDQLNISWAQASDLQGVESPVAITYGVHFTPTTYIIDDKGVIVTKYSTGEELLGDLEKLTGKTFSHS